VTVLTEVSPVLPFDVEVVDVVRLSPTFVRLTFGGPALADFHGGGPLGPRDLRIKVMVPAQGHPLPDLSDMSEGWYRRWLAIDPAVRGSMRTYTVRNARLDRPDPSIDVDFVLHLDEQGRGGPASSWAASARVGDRLTLIGPNARSDSYGGIEWQPPTAAPGHPVTVMLAGDETAVPAIGSVLESLPTGYVGQALLEVPKAADFQDLRTAADVEVAWFARGGRPHGEALHEALAAAMATHRPAGRSGPVELPDVDVDSEILWERAEGDESGCYAWIAGEAAMVRGLRSLLVQDLGLDRRSVTFMGYWRHGKTEIG
jgi:iron complex transport system ATP-binding protein